MGNSQDLQAVVDAFNRDNQFGAFVQYWTGPREGRGKFSTTRSAAELLSGHTPVVWWGFRLNVGHDDAEDPTSPLTIGANFSDADQARGIVVRETTPEQLEELARLLLTIAAKQRARTTPPVAYADRCPDRGPHLWVGRDGRPATGDGTDRCDACGAQRSTVTRPYSSEGGEAR